MTSVPRDLAPSTGLSFSALSVAPSIGQLQTGVVYVVAYLLAYVALIAPNFTGLGIVNRLAGDGSLFLATLLAVLAAGWLPRRASRPSDAALWILYLAVYVPSMLAPPFVLGTGWALLPLWLTMAASFAMIIVLVRGTALSLPTIDLSVRAYGWLLGVMAVAGTVAIVLVFGIPTGIPNLVEVTAARIDFRESLAGAGRFAGYVVWWTGAVIAPLLIAFGAWTRHGPVAIAGFALLALIYASAAFRSMIFVALLVVVMLVLVARVRRDFGPAIGGLTTALIAACAVVAAAGWIVPLSLLVRRLLVVPGQVLAFYYDAFSDGPVYGLSHSILAGVVPRPYPESPAALIGERYFHDPAINANGNLWADGLANLGLPGIVVASLGVGVILIALDAAARGKPAVLAITVAAVGIWSLTNSGLLTTLMTHGLGLMVIMVWLMPKAVPRTRPDGSTVVAHVTSVHPSNDPRIYLKECATLVQAGYDVVLIGRGAAPAHDVGARFVSLGDAPGRLTRMLVMPIRVLRAARHVRATLYHLHDPELLPVGVLLRLLGARVVYDAHEDLPRQVAYKPYLPSWARPLVALGAAALEHLAVRLLDAVVAATPRIAARFPDARTTTVQNFPTSAEFGSPPSHDYADREALVVYVGRLTAEIGGSVMADAARHLLWARRDLRVVLAGPADPAFAASIEARTMPAPIELPGRVDRSEVVSLLGSARVGLVLFQPIENYVEAYPTKLFEYMASELPVVASDFPVWRRIVADADCGILVDPTDATAVAAAVEALLADPEAAAAMGRRGRAAVMEHYRWEPQGAQLVALYRRILSVDPADEPVTTPLPDA